jgi:predicted anti-sigma-YlaC factor YlaD
MSMAGESILRCEPARQLASIRLDGELSVLEAAMLDRHLASCPSCRRWAGDAGEIATALREAPLEQPSRPVVPTRSERRTPWRLLVAVAVVAVTAASASVLGVVLSGGSSQKPQPSVPFISLLPDGGRAPVGHGPFHRPELRMPAGDPV